MPDPQPSAAFVRLVRSALAHLYDYAYLQSHPLTVHLPGSADMVTTSRAQRLRGLLLDCIEGIKPERTGQGAAEADRIHAVLTYRYVDGLTMDQAAEKRGLGERQAYRALEMGVEAVARLLYDRLSVDGADLARIAAEAEATSDAPVQLAQAEVARLKQAAHNEPLQLDDVLVAILELLQPLQEQTGSRIAVTSPSPWPPVLADRIMLRQALLSLLTNALEYIVRGDLIVSATPAQHDLVLTISESLGVERMRPPQPSTESPELGPAVVLSLLEAQGGSLHAETVPGMWQAVVRLPLAASATVLVIDDNADLVSLLQRYLASQPIRVVGATNGEEGIRLAAQLLPRVITLDVMMPDQDGWEVFRRLSQSPATRDIPVVICSILREATLAATMGASAYITKPVTQADLLAVLGRWLGPLRSAE